MAIVAQIAYGKGCKMRSKRFGSSATPYLGATFGRKRERHECSNGSIEETRMNPVLGLNTCLQW